MTVKVFTTFNRDAETIERDFTLCFRVSGAGRHNSLVKDQTKKTRLRINGDGSSLVLGSQVIPEPEKAVNPSYPGSLQAVFGFANCAARLAMNAARRAPRFHGRQTSDVAAVVVTDLINRVFVFIFFAPAQLCDGVLLRLDWAQHDRALGQGFDRCANFQTFFRPCTWC